MNIDTFNETVFGAFKEEFKNDKGMYDLLRTELELTMYIFSEEVGILLNELTENGYESEQFQKVGNIKASAEHILIKMGELEEEECNDEKL